MHVLYLPFFPYQSRGDLVLGQLWRVPISPLVRVAASARTAHMYVIGMSAKGQSSETMYTTNRRKLADPLLPHPKDLC